MPVPAVENVDDLQSNAVAVNAANNEPEVDQELDLESALIKAYDEVEAAEKKQDVAAPGPSEPAPKPEVKPEVKEPKKDEPQSKQVSRQKGGKEGSEPQADAKAKEPEPKPLDVIEPPVSWRTDAKAAFGQLPVELQKEVKRVHEAERADYLQKTREISAKEEQLRQHYGDVPEVLKPYLTAWSAQGKSPGQVVGNLLQMQNFAATKPGDFLLWFANQYGVDVSRLSQAQQVGATRDPYQQHLNRQLQGLQSQIQQQGQYLAKQAKGSQDAETSSLVREVEAFRAATDKTGELKHPYLREVQAEFKAFIPLVMQDKGNAAPQEVFAEAYERAVMANPSTRARVLQTLEARRLKRIEEDTAAADKAGKLITGNAAGNNKPPDEDDLDAVLRWAWDEAEHRQAE